MEQAQEETPLQVLSRLKMIENLMRSRGFRHYLHKKANYELKRLLAKFNLSYVHSFKYHWILNHVIRELARLGGDKVETILQRAKEDYFERFECDEKVWEGLCEMVRAFAAMYDMLQDEFNKLIYIRKLRESGRSVDLLNFKVIELEFADDNVGGSKA